MILPEIMEINRKVLRANFRKLTIKIMKKDYSLLVPSQVTKNVFKRIRNRRKQRNGINGSIALLMLPMIFQ